MDYTDLKRRLESGDQFDSDGFPYADLSALHSDAIAAIAALEAEVANLRAELTEEIATCIYSLQRHDWEGINGTVEADLGKFLKFDDVVNALECQTKIADTTKFARQLEPGTVVQRVVGMPGPDCDMAIVTRCYGPGFHRIMYQVYGDGEFYHDDTTGTLWDEPMYPGQWDKKQAEKLRAALTDQPAEGGK